MSEEFRLAFSGELEEGQHPAVVKKRLAAVLKLDDERMDVLFSGTQVILKRSADAKAAARLQEVFKKAGARLEILPAKGAPGNEDSKPTDSESASSDPSRPDEEPDDDGLNPGGDSVSRLAMMPVGSDVLREEERDEPIEAQIDTSHLSVQGATFTVPEPEPEVATPNVDHITVAAPGADIGVPQEEIVVEIDVDFDLAEVGAILQQLEDDEPVPAVDLDRIDFAVADPGAVMDTSPKEPPPPAPDTSHLSLADDDSGPDSGKTQ